MAFYEKLPNQKIEPDSVWIDQIWRGVGAWPRQDGQRGGVSLTVAA